VEKEAWMAKVEKKTWMAKVETVKAGYSELVMAEMVQGMRVEVRAAETCRRWGRGESLFLPSYSSTVPPRITTSQPSLFA
jgi:hypothetical protein